MITLIYIARVVRHLSHSIYVIKTGGIPFNVKDKFCSSKWKVRD